METRDAGGGLLTPCSGLTLHCGAAVHIHGECGYVKELPIERYYRDSILLQVGEGINDIQRLLIARRLVEKYPATP